MKKFILFIFVITFIFTISINFAPEVQSQQSSCSLPTIEYLGSGTYDALTLGAEMLFNKKRDPFRLERVQSTDASAERVWACYENCDNPFIILRDVNPYEIGDLTAGDIFRTPLLDQDSLAHGDLKDDRIFITDEGGNVIHELISQGLAWDVEYTVPADGKYFLSTTRSIIAFAVCVEPFATPTPTATFTSTPTSPPTATATATTTPLPPTATATNTPPPPEETPTATPKNTATPTNTPEPTATATNTPKPPATSSPPDIEVAVSIGNLVWYDVNNNGVVDTNEPSIAGVELQLFHAGDNPENDTPLQTEVSDENGHYLFMDLKPGTYFVYIPTPPSKYPVSSVITVDQDNQVDNDDNGGQPDGPGRSVRSPDILLTAGQEPINDTDEDNNSDLTIDFGFTSIPTAIDIETELPATQTKKFFLPLIKN